MVSVYGPVPSWRLGRSLGIDPIPFKTCNWNCVYCQLGRTHPVVNERREAIPLASILRDLRRALAEHPVSEIDWVTVVGSGEPLLYARIGELLRAVKSMTDLPVALITNGSLLSRPEVRAEVAAADAVMPTLDTGRADRYRRINRPHPAATYERHVGGLEALRREYPGRIWLEVMLVAGVNDDDAALEELALRLERIRPDEIHLNVPTRPPVESWVRAPSDDRVGRAAEILGRVAHVRAAPPPSGEFAAVRDDDAVEAIVAIVARHPMTDEQIVRALARRSPAKVREALDHLERSGRVRVVVRNGTAFRVSAESWLPEDEAAARLTRP